MAENPPGEPPPFLLKWGSRGTLGGQFENTYDVATDSQGNVYFTDGRNSTCEDPDDQPPCPADDPPPNDRIQKFDRYGNFLASWGWDVVIAGRPGDLGSEAFEVCTAPADCKAGHLRPGAGDGQFSSPRGIAIDRFDKVYVTDANNNRVQKLGAGGTYEHQWGGRGQGARYFDHPRGIAADSAGNVYVADAANNRIQKFTSDGTFIAAWGWDVVGDATETDETKGFQVCTSAISAACKAGLSGSGDGQFSSPFGVAIDAKGDVYVTDALNHRVQELTSEGAFITKWGSRGSGVGQLGEPQFNEPRDIAFDVAGNIYVVDGRNYRVQELTASGTYITEWGSRGSGDGEFGLDDGDLDHHPYGLAIGPSGDIYVADTWNRRIQEFGVDPAFSIAPATQDFGDQAVAAGPSAARTFTVTNTGDENLVVSSLGLVGAEADQFRVVVEGCAGPGRSLPPASSCTVSVAFDPASTALKQAALRVSHDAAGSPAEVTLHGTGTEAAASPMPTPISPTPGFPLPPGVSPALPPPASIGVEVIVAKRTVVLRKGAAFGAEIACPTPRTQTCQGKIEVQAKAPGKKRRKPVVIGSAYYGVPPGARATIVIKLNRAGARLLLTGRLGKRLPVTLAAMSSLAGSPAIAPTKTVLLLRAKRKTR